MLLLSACWVPEEDDEDDGRSDACGLACDSGNDDDDTDPDGGLDTHTDEDSASGCAAGPTVVIVEPTEGQRFEVDEPFDLIAVATSEVDVDPLVEWTVIDERGNEERIGDGDGIRIVIADAGEYVVRAEVSDACVTDEGFATASATVTIEIEEPEPIEYAGTMTGLVISGGWEVECEGDVDFTVLPDGSLVGDGTCDFDFDLFTGPLEGSVDDGLAEVTWNASLDGSEMDFQFVGEIDESEASLTSEAEEGDYTFTFLIEAEAKPEPM